MNPHAVFIFKSEDYDLVSQLYLLLHQSGIITFHYKGCESDDWATFAGHRAVTTPYPYQFAQAAAATTNVAIFVESPSTQKYLLSQIVSDTGNRILFQEIYNFARHTQNVVLRVVEDEQFWERARNDYPNNDHIRELARVLREGSRTILERGDEQDKARVISLQNKWFNQNPSGQVRLVAQIVDAIAQRRNPVSVFRYVAAVLTRQEVQGRNLECCEELSCYCESLGVSVHDFIENHFPEKRCQLKGGLTNESVFESLRRIENSLFVDFSTKAFETGFDYESLKLTLPSVCLIDVPSVWIARRLLPDMYENVFRSLIALQTGQFLNVSFVYPPPASSVAAFEHMRNYWSADERAFARRHVANGLSVGSNESHFGELWAHLLTGVVYPRLKKAEQGEYANQFMNQHIGGGH